MDAHGTPQLGNPPDYALRLETAIHGPECFYVVTVEITDPELAGQFYTSSYRYDPVSRQPTDLINEQVGSNATANHFGQVMAMRMIGGYGGREEEGDGKEG